jgi:dipeptidyl aminopeptidase/acylaminoacyl peptidase
VSPVAPYGLWPSPIEPAAVAAARRSASALSSDGWALWWLEVRPEEEGRTVLVRAEPGRPPAVVSPAGVSMRSRVHEYGGGAWCLLDAGDGTFAFVEDRSQRVFVASPHGEARPLGAAPTSGQRWRHGGLVRLSDGAVVAVREELDDRGSRRSLVRLGPGGAESTLCSGRDFYGSVAVAPDGRRLAWVVWDHPDMPWDATELWVGELGEAGVVGAARVRPSVLGGCSVDQPVWMGPDALCFVADPSGWWQPWRLEAGRLERLCDLEAEFQGPAWSLGQHTLVALGEGRLGCTWRRDGIDHLGVLESSGRLHPIEQPCVTASFLSAHRGSLAWIGQTERSLPALWWHGPGGSGSLGGQAPAPLDPNDVSVAEPFSVTRAGRPVYAAWYRPRLRGWEGPAGAAPPLVVFCHGGPTASASRGLDLAVQLLTTRGYAVATVDYAGSTGYGRAYRQALEGRWGEADVDDCVAAAEWLAARGLVDGARMAIRGASAGGLTALGALVRSDRFVGAVSWYGVSDLVRLASESHDFEAGYSERLVGAPASAWARSPVHRADAIAGAVLLLQGEEDPVVPARQALALAEALRARGVPCTTLVFSGESHGFRQAETLTAAYQAELDFYRELLVGPTSPARGPR